MRSGGDADGEGWRWDEGGGWFTQKLGVNERRRVQHGQSRVARAT